MNSLKVKQAQRFYGMIQGIRWAKEKCLEYDHYDQAKKCDKEISNILNEIEKLKLTNEENIEAINNTDMDVAESYYWRFR